MNPFRLAAGLSARPWQRLGLGALGIAILVGITRQVDWRQFRIVFASLGWPWILASVLLGCCAMCFRALRLALVLEKVPHFGGVWRALALGYLGTLLLPLGGGELVKTVAVRKILDLPAASAAAGVVLDRMFDLLGLGILLGVLAGTGVAVKLRTGPIWIGASALAALLLAMAFLLYRRARQRRTAISGTGPSGFGHTLDSIARILAGFKRPAHLGRLLLAQAAVTFLDVAAIHVGLQAFSFGKALAVLISVKLSAYIMLGAALPLLPGGLGSFQVACLLALQPAGISSAEAFAYSLVAQGAGSGTSSLLGTAAACWPNRRIRA